MLVEYEYSPSCGMGYNIVRISDIANHMERKGYNVVIKSNSGEKYGSIMDYFNRPFNEIPNIIVSDGKQAAKKLPIISDVKVSITETAARHFRPINVIMDKVYEILKPLNNPIGIHIRRGDSYGQIPWLPANFILKTLTSIYPQRDVFVCSDSELATIKMSKALEESGINHVCSPCLKYKTTMPFWGGIHKSNFGTADERASGIIIDMFCLINCSARFTQASCINNACQIIAPYQPVLSMGSNSLEATLLMRHQKIVLTDLKTGKNIEQKQNLIIDMYKEIMILQKSFLKKSFFEKNKPKNDFLEELCESCQTPQEYLIELKKLKDSN